MEEKKFDIFLSHKHQDIEIAQDVKYILGHLDVEVYIDVAEHISGSLPEKLKNAIVSSRYFVFLASKKSTSSWIADEVSIVLEYLSNQDGFNTIIILKIEDDCEIPAKLKALNIRQIDGTRSLLAALIDLVCIVKLDSSKGLSADGVIKIFLNRANISADLWDKLYKYSTRVDLMGHSISRPFTTRSKDITKEAIKTIEAKYRVLFLNPALSYNKQLLDIKISQHGEDIYSKNRKVINEIRRLKTSLLGDQRHGNLRVKLVDKIMYSNIAIFDSIAFITHYAKTEEPGDSSPTFVVIDKGDGPDSLYKFYTNQFEQYWREGIHPEEHVKDNFYGDTQRIVTYVSHIKKIRDWITGKRNVLPYPAQIIIYPTYACEWEGQSLCQNCAYKEKLDKNKHLSYDALYKVIQESVDLGIKRFEFSGGGEPTLYKDFDRLLDLCEYFHNYNNKIRFGLLSNGINILEAWYDKLIGCFSYIRFDYAEAFMENNKLETIFFQKLNLFIEFCKDNAEEPYIGLKCLLSRNKSDFLIGKIEKLKNELGQNFSRINHIRIKSLRSLDKLKYEPTEEDRQNFKAKFFEQIYLYRDEWPKDIQVDLKLRNAHEQNRHRCFMNPLYAIVDPDAGLLICFNYLNTYKNLYLGSIENSKIADLWGTEEHKNKIMNIIPGKVCDAGNGCPCRFSSYQEISESLYLKSLDEFERIKAVDGFV